eukprot:CAMPEP_0170592388 /NCGR_PEP_ID=MMETSP0224-20130122/12898_1 /TAXON_ID=285029 /ORGANISM="Togula jolla, Strain CCCM 725" /LENGTH=558 /DNA_ID=CAMNT_0010916291 /DNA_START=100 /DNA_END=1776 /DNA_ORIENTATION=-
MYLLTLATFYLAQGKTFLEAGEEARIHRDLDFRSAMTAVLGCGGKVDMAQTDAIREVLVPMWRALPKNANNRVDWKMLRYMTHRYFMQTSSLLIRGFEPSRQINDSHAGNAEIFSKQVPSIVETMLQGKLTLQGFTLEDAVILVATVQQLIYDSEGALLEKVYQDLHVSTSDSLNHSRLWKIIEAYMIHWLMGDDPIAVHALMRNHSLREIAFPHWRDLVGFASGVLESMEFVRERAPQPGDARMVLSQQFSFNDAHRVVVDITKSFASYWETECQAIKTSLVALDKTATGRVKLADFYGANTDGEWRFGESEAYLRELGALDESSIVRGKQVIITNYLLGASNCIVGTDNYLVCCLNECNGILYDIEAAVGGPLAKPSDVLALIGNMSNYEDEPAKLDAALRAQLHRVAEAHGGLVPLHGRLFAQWLHYVFPRECPFPHKAGASNLVTPVEFGDSYMATDHEVQGHAASRNVTAENIHEIEEVQWMSQWSEEEELIGDYSLQLVAPWAGNSLLVCGGLAAALVGLGLLGGASSLGSGKSPRGGSARSFTDSSKAHFV